MNRIEEWLKKLPLPKFMPGDVVYIVKDRVLELKVTEVQAYYSRGESRYAYTLEGETEDTYYVDEEDVFVKENEAELIYNKRALQDREENLKRWIMEAEWDLGRLKALTPEGIEERIKGCEEDKVNWTKDLEDVQKQIKELEEEE